MIDSVATGLTEDVPGPIWTEDEPGRVKVIGSTGGDDAGM